MQLDWLQKRLIDATLAGCFLFMTGTVPSLKVFVYPMVALCVWITAKAINARPRAKAE